MITTLENQVFGASALVTPNIWDVSIPAGRQGTRLYRELSCSLVTFGKDPAGHEEYDNSGDVLLHTAVLPSMHWKVLSKQDQEL